MDARDIAHGGKQFIELRGAVCIQHQIGAAETGHDSRGTGTDQATDLLLAGGDDEWESDQAGVRLSTVATSAMAAPSMRKR